MRRYLWVLLLAACTDEQAYDMLHPGQSREVGRYEQCFPCDDAQVIWVGTVPVTMYTNGTCCETVRVKVCQ